jgi:hypothetical protein
MAQRGTWQLPLRGYLCLFQAARAGAGSGEVHGRALFSRLPVLVASRGSFMGCALDRVIIGVDPASCQ